MEYRQGWGKLEHEIHFAGVKTIIHALNSGVMAWHVRGNGAWDSNSQYALTESVLTWLFDHVGQEDQDWYLVRGDTFNLYLAFPTKAQAMLFKLTFA